MDSLASPFTESKDPEFPGVCPYSRQTFPPRTRRTKFLQRTPFDLLAEHRQTQGPSTPLGMTIPDAVILKAHVLCGPKDLCNWPLRRCHRSAGILR
jgi:hypothetical protein